MYFPHQIFVPSEIQRYFYIHTLFSPHFQIWPFWPQETKNSNLTSFFLSHYPQAKMNQKSPKDPKLILILLYTYFRKTLPAGALIWLAPIWLTWAQIAQPTSNHQKTIQCHFVPAQFVPVQGGGSPGEGHHDWQILVLSVWSSHKTMILRVGEKRGTETPEGIVFQSSEKNHGHSLFRWFEEVARFWSFWKKPAKLEQAKSNHQ